MASSDSEAAMDLPPETTSLLHHFAALKGPRQRIKVVYPLPEILLLVLSAIVVVADDFVEVQHRGELHIDFQRRFLPNKDSIPSHDALNDLMNALNSALFPECFVTWVNSPRDDDPDIVAVDGKTSRCTHAKSKVREPLHPVSAWASRQRLVLGREATHIKSNEITTIPLLLERLELKGALVTFYAMGCQTKIAVAILDRGADYLLAVKDNQPALHDDIKRYIDDAPPDELETFQTTDANQSRIEGHRHVVSHKVDWPAGDSRFPGIKTIAMVENRDVTFHEDLSRLRTGHGTHNMRTGRHMAMNLPRSARPGKSLKVRRKVAGWNPNYLHVILQGVA
jgi:predicted transposase YbfD/YdcC